MPSDAPLDVHLVRTSITTVLQRLLDRLSTEIEKRRSPIDKKVDECSKRVTLDHLAAELAGARGTKAPPHHGRQHLEDRKQGAALALLLLLGDEDAVASLQDSGVHLEQMMGLNHARHPQGAFVAWLRGSPGDWRESFAQLGGLPALIATIQTATDEELAASRVAALLLIDAMAALTRMLSPLVGADNPVRMGTLATLSDDPTTAVFIPTLVVALRRSSVLRDNLETIVNA